MPQAAVYRANSIIYFKGDVSDRIFILKAGKVSLNYTDIETGQEIHELIKTGEFFGVKSALGKYPRDETALVLQDSSVITFSVPEFEALVMKNPRIIMKMMKVFSNQLRRIHKQVRNLLYSDEQVNPETGLFRIGEYYLKTRQFQRALYVYQRYLTYYPSGAHANDATRRIQEVEHQAHQPQNRAPAAAATSANTDRGRELSDVAKTYYNAVSLFSQQKYQDAMKAFKSIAGSGADPEYAAKSEYEIGRCLFQLEKYDLCIRQFSSLVQKYPKHPDMKDALYFVGKSYEEKGDVNRAANFYKKILSMTSDDDPLFRKVRKSMKSLAGRTA